MRCPSCGTENAPDSRFCGVCGAKQAPPGRLAPTAKIPDDAPFPQPTGQRPQIQQGYQQGPASIPPQPSPYASTGPASIPPSSGPASIPPKGPASIPPHVYQRAATPQPVDSQRATPLPPELRPSSQDPAFVPQTSQRARVPLPAPAGSMAGDSFVVPPQRSLGMIAIVLVIDLALAGSGAVMLAKGLAKKKPADTSPPAAPELKMQQRSDVRPTPAPTPTPAPSPSPPEAVAAAASPAPAVAAATPVIEAKPDKTATRDKDKKTKTTKGGGVVTSPTTSPSTGPTTSPNGPITDPGHDDSAAPAGFDLKGEANKLAAGSNDLFTRCLGAAGKVHGQIKIAYQVNPDGTVTHPFAVENSTSNDQLGQCLADVIATWRFSAHAGEVQNAVRPFTYP